MKLLLPLGIAVTAVAFLMGALSSLPVANKAYASSQSLVASDGGHDAQVTRRPAGLFSNKYTALIDDIASFQSNPDFRRADAKRQKIVDVSESSIALVENFESKLQGVFDSLIGKLWDLVAGSSEG